MSGARLLEMPSWECFALLRERSLGRVCVTASGYPLTFPISYRVADVPWASMPVIVMRTRPGSTIGRGLGLASVEIDEIDAAQGKAWSVLARGMLGPVHDVAGLPSPQPWLHDGRHEWLILEPHVVTGRRFVAAAGDTFSVDWEVTG